MSDKTKTASNEVKAGRYLRRLVPYYASPFRSPPKATDRPSIEEALNWIRSDKWKGVIAPLRKMWSKKDRDRVKKGFGAFVFAYNFQDKRLIEEATLEDDCSYVITMDFDALGTEAAIEARKALAGDPSVIAAFISPSGDGLKALMAWRGDLSNFAGAWTACADHVLDKYMLLADSSGKDITRICYQSWDPDAYVAPKDKHITPIKAKRLRVERPVAAEKVPDDTPLSDSDEAILEALERKQRFARVESMLSFIDPTFRGSGDEIAEGVCDDRTGWVKICLATVGALGFRTDTRDLLLRWSKNEVRHPGAEWPEGEPESFGDEDTFQIAWRSFGKPRGAGRPAGMGTITACAKALGWKVSLSSIAADGEEWEAKLARNENGKVKAGEANTLMILRHHSLIRGQLRWNDLLSRVEVSDVPWDRDVDAGISWTATDGINCGVWLQSVYKAEWKARTIDEAVIAVARKDSYHPVADYLKTLKWDGTSRLGKWLHEAFGATQTPYHAVVGRKFLISAVARALRPGCKVDTMLILEGGQGLKKSTALQVLAGRDWFSDSQIVVGDKDALMMINRFWIYELPEMHSYRRAEADLMKAFLSRQVDSFRSPYERVVTDHPRRLVFIGTTNEANYLKDTTGNRRFWPVAIHRSNIRWLKENREQLWAEAVEAFGKGEEWWLDADGDELAKKEQLARMEVDPWDEKLDTYLDAMRVDRIHSNELMTMCLELRNPTSADARRVCASMERLGWKLHKKLTLNGRMGRGYTFLG